MGKLLYGNIFGLILFNVLAALYGQTKGKDITQLPLVHDVTQIWLWVILVNAFVVFYILLRPILFTKGKRSEHHQ